jgi:hypothetical protein
VDEVRRERQGLYDLWLAEQSRAEAEAARLDMTLRAAPGAEG